MKLQSHPNELITNVEEESQDFTIGDASKIIEILRNHLYSRKIGTPIQEIISNCRDACREAGKKDNDFFVTVPTRLNPVFSARDYGIGLTPQRVKEIFIRYGSSTKRDDNLQTGSFGLGSKSFWAYTDSFTVITYLDGVRRSYVAHIGTSYQGRLDLVSTGLTDEPNGTEVQVAVKPYDIEEFRRGIFRAIYFWDERPTLKGELDQPERAKGNRLSDLVEIVDSNLIPSYIFEHSYDEKALAVIDGIPYPIEEEIINKNKNFLNTMGMLKNDLILHFGNGVVELAASRESITGSELTRKAFEKIASRANLEVQTHVKNAFGKVRDTSQYLQTYKEMSKDFNVDGFATFGKYSIRQDNIESQNLKEVRMTMISTLNRRGRRVNKITRTDFSDHRKSIHIEELNHLFFVSKDESKIQMGKRIREYLKTNTKMILIYPLTVTHTDAKGVQTSTTHTKSYTEVLKDLGVKDFNTIAYTEVPKEQRVKILREDTEFCIHTVYGTRHKYVTLAKNTQKYFFLPMKDGTWDGGHSKGELSDLQDYLELKEKAHICGVAERAIKMIQGDPNFLPLADYLKNYKPTKDVIAKVKQINSLNQTDIETIHNLKDLDDEFLNEMIQEYKFSGAAKSLVPHILAKKVEEEKEYKEFEEKDEKLTKLIKSEYPLITEIDRYSKCRGELGFYINSKFNRKGK